MNEVDQFLAWSNVMGILEVLRHQIELDEATLRHLAERGDDSKVERLVDHSFWGQETDSLERLAAFLEQIGFQGIQVKEGQNKEKEVYFYLETQTSSKTDWHSVSKTSALMRCLAAIFGVQYDGWGTHVEKQGE